MEVKKDYQHPFKTKGNRYLYPPNPHTRESASARSLYPPKSPLKPLEEKTTQKHREQAWAEAFCFEAQVPQRPKIQTSNQKTKEKRKGSYKELP
ncbi:hypothetical protein ACLWBD_07005 [Bdellovibrio sp. HCB117]|uniref:hypothetical protein n=1 Tax=Bdellovibrio sp. HCB117 TaxID=3394359 RepID=UPI0039B4C998